MSPITASHRSSGGEESEGTPFKVTLKAGGGHEAPWLTVDGETTEDLGEKLEALTEELLQQVTDVAALFRAAHNVSLGALAGEPPAANGATVTQLPTGAGSDLKTCAHGVREYREGTKNGKSWAGWFCPSQNKSQQCKPEWKD